MVVAKTQILKCRGTGRAKSQFIVEELVYRDFGISVVVVHFERSMGLARCHYHVAVDSGLQNKVSAVLQDRNC